MFQYLPPPCGFLFEYNLPPPAFSIDFSVDIKGLRCPVVASIAKCGASCARPVAGVVIVYGPNHIERPTAISPAAAMLNKAVSDSWLRHSVPGSVDDRVRLLIMPWKNDSSLW